MGTPGAKRLAGRYLEKLLRMSFCLLRDVCYTDPPEKEISQIFSHYLSGVMCLSCNLPTPFGTFLRI